MFDSEQAARRFLREDWQRRPRLLENALPDWRDPLSPEELAGLACEEEAESRLVTRDRDGWQLRHGPFTESDFTSLPDRDWTLLVQAVDQWFPEVRALLREVAFLPRWRVDDIMISYAAPGGGVGPHFDYYDVFLVQGLGSRTWQLGDPCNAATPVDTRSGQKVLRDFTPREEYVLHSGDVLYIPPGVAHHGVADEAGLCYSIGFRAPSASEVLLGFAEEAAADLDEDLRFTDPGGMSGARPGEIPRAALDHLRGLLQRAMDNPQALARWFGSHMTEPRHPQLSFVPEQALEDEEMAALLRQGIRLVKNPASRFAFHPMDEKADNETGGGTLLLFADGESFALNQDQAACRLLALRLSALDEGVPLDLHGCLEQPDCLALLTSLYNLGSLHEQAP